MKHIQIVAAMLITGLMACAPSKKEESRTEEVGPRVREGYYAAENPENKNVPLVAVKITDNTTRSSAFSSYLCAGKVISAYRDSGYTLSWSGAASSAGGFELLYDSKCPEVGFHAEITADSDSTIKVIITEDKKVKDTYVLRRVSEETFIDGIKSLAVTSDSFDANDEACKNTLLKSCSAFGLDLLQKNN